MKTKLIVGLLVLLLAGCSGMYNSPNYNKQKCGILYSRARTHAETLTVDVSRMDRFADPCFFIQHESDTVVVGQGGIPPHD